VRPRPLASGPRMTGRAGDPLVRPGERERRLAIVVEARRGPPGRDVVTALARAAVRASGEGVAVERLVTVRAALVAARQVERRERCAQAACPPRGPPERRVAVDAWNRAMRSAEAEASARGARHRPCSAGSPPRRGRPRRLLNGCRAARVEAAAVRIGMARPARGVERSERHASGAQPLRGGQGRQARSHRTVAVEHAVRAWRPSSGSASRACRAASNVLGFQPATV